MQITTPELPKGIKRVLAKGNTYYYHRKTNTRINAVLGTQAFMDALAELEEGITRAKINAAAGMPETTTALNVPFTPIHPEAHRRNSIWLQLLASFERSTDWERIGSGWQRAIRRWANMAADRWPDMTAERASDDALYALVDDWRTEVHRDGRSTAADQLTAAMRRLTSYGRKARILPRNALVEKYTPMRAVASRVEIVFKLEWFTPAALKRLMDQDVSDAMELALWTGARVSDLCKLTWDMIDAEGWLSFEQSKVKKEVSRWVSLPTFALPPLAALLKRIKARQKALGYTGRNILTSTDPTGQKGTRALTAANLGQKWHGIKTDKAHPHFAELHWHDLRGTLASLLDEVGCEDKEIAACTGHAVKGAVPSLSKYRKVSRENALRAYKKLATYLAKR